MLLAMNSKTYFDFFYKGGCLWIWFGCNSCERAEYEIFGIAIFMGAGGAAMLINSLAIVASLIGNNLGKGIYLFISRNRLNIH